MNRMLVSMAAAIGMAVMPALAEDPETDLQGIIQWGVGDSSDMIMRSTLST